MKNEKWILAIGLVLLFSGLSFCSSNASLGVSFEVLSSGLTCGPLTDTTDSYVMTENITYSGNCFDVTDISEATGVTLDCQGFSLIGDGTGYAFLSIGSMYTTLKNCNIYDGDVVFESGEGHSVQNVIVNNDIYFGNGGLGMTEVDSLDVVDSSFTYMYGYTSLGVTFNNVTIPGGSSIDDVQLSITNSDYQGGIDTVSTGTEDSQIVSITNSSVGDLTVDHSSLELTNVNVSSITLTQEGETDYASSYGYLNSDGAVSITSLSSFGLGGDTTINGDFTVENDFGMDGILLNVTGDIDIGGFTDGVPGTNRIYASNIRFGSSDRLYDNEMTAFYTFEDMDHIIHNVVGNIVFDGQTSSEMYNSTLSGVVKVTNADTFNVHDNQINGMIKESGSTDGLYMNNTINTSIPSEYEYASGACISGDCFAVVMNGAMTTRAYNNTIIGDYWAYINDGDSTGMYMDDGESIGNKYYFSNGTGGWTVYDWITVGAPNWATSGNDIPFSSSYPEFALDAVDNYPWTENEESILTTPELYLPVNGTYDTNVTIAWNASINEDNDTIYEVEYNNGSEWISLYNTGNLTYYWNTTLVNSGTNYSVRVRGEDDGLYSNYSTSSTFEILHNIAPSIPILVSPVNGTIIDETTVNMTWNASIDPNNDTIYYTVCYGSALPLMCANTSNVWYNASVSPDLSYVWIVESWDSSNTTLGFSNVSEFLTAGATVVGLQVVPVPFVFTDPLGGCQFYISSNTLSTVNLTYWIERNDGEKVGITSINSQPINSAVQNSSMLYKNNTGLNQLWRCAVNITSISGFTTVYSSYATVVSSEGGGGGGGSPYIPPLNVTNVTSNITSNVTENYSLLGLDLNTIYGGAAGGLSITSFGGSEIAQPGIAIAAVLISLIVLFNSKPKGRLLWIVLLALSIIFAFVTFMK